MRGGGVENDTLTPPDDSAPVLPRPDPAAATHMAFGDHTLDPIEAAAERTPEGPGWIGRFVVFEELGAGGMGQVFAAYDPELDRKVALTLVQRAPDGAKIDDWQARLVREAQAMAKLSHPNVVTVYEVGAHAGQVFLAMELVQGSDANSSTGDPVCGNGDVDGDEVCDGSRLAGAAWRHRSGGPQVRRAWMARRGDAAIGLTLAHSRHRDAPMAVDFRPVDRWPDPREERRSRLRRGGL